MRNILILSLFLLLVAQAAFGKKYTNEQPLLNSAIAVGTTQPALCDGYSSLMQTGNPLLATTDMDRGFRLVNPYGLVKLSIPQRADNPATGLATVQVIVHYEYEKNGQILSGQTNAALSVEINAARFKDIDYIKIDHAVKVWLEITSVNNISSFPEIRLTTSCEGDIYRFLSASDLVTGVHYVTPPVRADGSLADGNLYVSWDNMPKAESYELEWTYISNQGATAGTTFTKSEITLRDYLFRNNSSRVATVNQGYFIPLVYEKGLIVFRVRATGKNIVEGALTDVKGEWSVIENQTSLSNVPDAYIYTFNGLENNLNWQSSISFAEEGKNKTVVSYHDGSLRNRQAVTRINTDQRAIVGETFYDYNGRPVIQVLPVPVEGTDENNLSFRPNYNIKDQQKTITKSDYDIAIPGQTCVPLAPKLDTSSGASRYYSRGNFFGSNGNTGQDILNKNYIPNAKKYPYTQTFYTNDNTDRILRQSGVGDAHIMGSGHETQYMYAAPLQGELSRLFGNQVGVSGHYKKNTVVDPNGQVSVSYLDLDGKVVATALAGTNRTGTDNLAGNSTRTISSNVLTNANNIPDSDGKGKTMLYPLTVTTKADYTLDYQLSAGTHTVSCKGINSTQPITLQMAGVFDATVALYDKCNTLIFSDSKSTLASFNPTVADQTQGITKTITQMDIGQYNLVKTIRINQAALDNYLQQYLSNKQYTCVLVDNDFLAHAYDNIDLSGCNLTCSQCKSKIDAIIQDLQNKNVALSAADKANLYERCDALCLQNNTCLSSLYGMIAGMAPDGQYGQVHKTNPALDNTTSLDLNNQSSNLDIDSKDFPVSKDDNGDPSISNDNSVVPEQFPLSIFNAGNALKPNKFLRSGVNSFYRADWRRPIQVNIPGNSNENFKNQLIFTEDLTNATYRETEYMDENGDTAFAYVQELPGGGYSPAVVGGAKVQLVDSQTDPKLYKVTLKNLVDVKEFLKAWQGHFANYLVPYHPEWKYYVECTSRQAINAYEEALIDMNALTDGTWTDYLSTETVGGVTYYKPDQFLAKDPVFTQNNTDPRWVSLINGFKNKLSNYQQQYDASGNPVPDPAHPGQFLYYTMAQASTVAVNCPDPTSGCKNPNCDIGKYTVNDVEEWTAFKSMYLAERQKVLRAWSTHNAIEGRYYNGCIGNSTFSGSSEQQLMLARYDVVPQLAALQAQASQVCGSAYPAPYTGFTYGISNFFGWGWRSYCQYLTGMVNSPYTLLRFNAIPLYDQDQTCNVYDAPMYAKKIRAFYPPLPGETAGGTDSKTCYEIVLDAQGKAQYVKTACNMGLLDQGAIISDADAVRSFKSCGHCPVVDQIQDLFGQLIDVSKLDGTANNFNCFVNTPSFGIGKELETQINNALSSNTLLSWTGSYNATTEALTGKITPGSISGNKTLVFTLDFSNSGIPKLSNATDATQIFQKIKISGITTDPVQNNKFVLKAYINFNTALPADYTATVSLLSGAATAAGTKSVFRYEFDIPGMIYTAPLPTSAATEYVAVNIESCSFRPVCSTSQYPTNVLSLLNTLTYSDPTDTDNDPQTVTPLKPYDLNQTVPVKNADIYEEPVRQLLGLTQKGADGFYQNPVEQYQASWAGTVAAGTLSGAITYTPVAGTTKTLQVNIIPVVYTASGNSAFDNSVDFTNISYFANIRPFDTPCNTPGICQSNKFYADAVVQQTMSGNANSFVYHRVVIEVISKTNGSTDPVQPFATKCEKIAGAGN